MDSYNIRFKRSVEKDMRRLPGTVLSRIMKRLESLSLAPFPAGARKLAGTKYFYRVRVGDYRIIYAVDSFTNSITIHYVRHRRNAYRNL